MLGELAAAVRNRRVSAVELVQASLERIERLNPALGAVTTLRAERALEDARAVDALSVLGSDALLAGLPLLVKDNTDVAGMVTHYGSTTMQDRPPAERNELTVDRLVEQGAVIVGRTNIPEFAFQGWTANDVFGITRNPWGVEWSPGGSSGGAGSAMAAGLAPLATASDGGGSTRTPAAFCGLVGMKPTSGMIGRRPIPSWMEVSTQGPLGASVADVKLLLEIMRGRVHGDPTAGIHWSYRGGMPKRVLATTRTWDLGPLPAGVEERFRAALDAIDRDLGIPVEEIAPADVFPGVVAAGGHGGMDWWITVAVEELEWLGREWVQANLSGFSAAFRGEMEKALGVGISDYLAVKRRRFLYTDDLDRLLGEDAVLVCPSHGLEGWPADGVLPDTGAPAGAEGYNMGEFNLSGHPSLSVPAGTSSNGLPFGLLINGPRWRDDLVLEFAGAWERAQPWPGIAPGYEPFAGA